MRGLHFWQAACVQAGGSQLVICWSAVEKEKRIRQAGSEVGRKLPAKCTVCGGSNKYNAMAKLVTPVTTPSAMTTPRPKLL